MVATMKDKWAKAAKAAEEEKKMAATDDNLDELRFGNIGQAQNE